MQLQESLARFSESGIALFAISPDSEGTLATFARQRGITYPLLSDADSIVIRAFGLLNTLIRKDEAEYGIPYPGSYLVGPDGRVIGKSFHREYQVRETAATMLRTGFGVEPDANDGTLAARARDPVSGVRIEARLGASSLSFMQHADLYVGFALPAGIHLYGRPVPDGYQAVDLEVSAAVAIRVGETAFPPTRALRIPALDEEFHVFEGRPVIRLPIILAERPCDAFVQLTLNVRVRYQACTDEMCFAPAAEVLQIAVPVVA